jgi:hypothetical protein
MAVAELREVRDFRENLGEINDMPDRTIVRKLNENSHPFSENDFFSHNPSALAADEFKRCVELYNRRCPNGGNPMTAMMLMQEVMLMEDPDKEELQEVAIDLVREMYNVPDTIDLRGMLEQKDSPEDVDGGGDMEEDEDNISDERKAELQHFIDKRRILNSIVHGCAVHQWTSAYYIAQERLNEINPELIDKYNKIAALVNYFNWMIYFEPMFDMGQMPMLQGINKVNVEERKIEAYGINFPVLIHELSKGVIDYITTAGVPNFENDGVTPEELKYIYAEADKYSHEQWHYFFGPTLWRAMLNTADVGSDELIPIIRKMSEMEYEELAQFCNNIVFYPEEFGKDAMEELID